MSIVADEWFTIGAKQMTIDLGILLQVTQLRHALQAIPMIISFLSCPSYLLSSMLDFADGHTRCAHCIPCKCAQDLSVNIAGKTTR